MITCKKNDRLLELLWFIGYSIEFPTQLAVRIGGGAEWNRRVMYAYIRIFSYRCCHDFIEPLTHLRDPFHFVYKSIDFAVILATGT